MYNDPGQRRLLFWAVVCGCWSLSVLFTADVIRTATDPRALSLGYDSHAYWHAWQQHLYRQNLGTHFNRYLYSPLFAQLLWPLTLLPWRLFVTMWSGVTALMFMWLLWPVRLVWRVPLFAVLCLHESFVGNVNALLAAMMVVGFHKPAVWSFALLTKVAPGMGLLWFAVRSEWHALRIVAVTTSSLVLVSAIAAPDLWQQWGRLLTAGGVETQTLIPYWLQVVLAFFVVLFAALTDRRWLLAVAVLLCLPVVSILSLSLLAAIPRLALPRSQSENAGLPLGRNATQAHLPRTIRRRNTGLRMAQGYWTSNH